MSIEIPDFGIYRPLSQESAARLGAVVSDAAQLLTERYAELSFRPVEGFRVTLATVADIRRQLSQPEASTFDLQQFKTRVQASVRPWETDQLTERYGPGGGAYKVAGSGNRAFGLGVGASELPTQRDWMEKLFNSAGGGTIKMSRADTVPLLVVKDRETGAKASPAAREAVRSVLKMQLVTAKIRWLVFDRMVIGPSIYEPLPGTEWPPSS